MAGRARMLFDAFHHMMPGHRIGRHIATGGYAVNFGRYAPGDCYHPNGLAFLQASLSHDFEIRLLCEPYSDLSLFDADVLLITNPDYPLYEGASPYRWTPEDVEALVAFLERGGGVLLCVNSFLSRPDFWEENFDLERISLLFDRLGVCWDPNYMSDDQNIERARGGEFVIGYGQGGRVLGGKLPEGCEPLITYGDNVYGFRTTVGKGQLAVIGDTGLISNGLVCFPGYDNLAFLKDLFADLTPTWVHAGAGQWHLLQSRHLSSAPSETGLNESTLRSLRPDATWTRDYHYRHLTWDGPGREDIGDEVWRDVPVSLDGLSDARFASVDLNWLSLDADDPGPPINLELTVSASKRAHGTDLHLIGSAQSEELSWQDLCADAERMKVAGEIERVCTVFEMKAVLDELGKPAKARWSQGQFVYSRSASSSHYGYEIILTSLSGAVVPVAS